MSQRSPLVTLAALTVAFGVVFGANAATSGTDAAPLHYPPPTAAAPSPTGTPTPRTQAAPRALSPRPASERVYVGRTADGSVAVAVAVLGDRAAAYLCDGRRVEAWLSGRVEGDDLVLRGRDGSWLRAAVDGDRLTGRVLADGDRHRFTGRRAGKPAGIYRARGGDTTIGWIVLPDGSQVGVRTGAQGSTPAPELDPSRSTVPVDGSPTAVAAVSGDDPV